MSSKIPEIHVGFNLNHKWLNGRPFDAVVQPLIEAGLGALELHLDLRIPELAEHIESLCENAAQSGLGVSFHAPYLDPSLMHGFAREKRDALIEEWKPMLALVNRWAGVNGIRTEITMHGAHGPNADYADLFDDTVAIALYILEQCPNAWLGIENLPVPRHPDEMVKYGEDRKTTLDAVRTVDHPRCGITWDMGHCVRDKVFTLPNPEWTSRVIHAHIHDVDDHRQDHWPLILGSTPYKEWITHLVSAGFSGTLTAELNGALYGEWSQAEIDSRLLMTIKEIKSAVAQAAG